MAVVNKRRSMQVQDAPDGSQERLFTRDLMGDQIEVCSFCAEPHAVAFWHSGDLVKTCSACALAVLPKLLADAMVGEHTPHERTVAQLIHSWERAEAHFWRSAAIAITRNSLDAQREAREPTYAEKLAEIRRRRAQERRRETEGL